MTHQEKAAARYRNLIQMAKASGLVDCSIIFKDKEGLYGIIHTSLDNEPPGIVGTISNAIKEALAEKSGAIVLYEETPTVNPSNN